MAKYWTPINGLKEENNGRPFQNAHPLYKTVDLYLSDEFE